MQLPCIDAPPCGCRVLPTPLTLEAAHLDGARRRFRVAADRTVRHALVTSSRAWLPSVQHRVSCCAHASHSRLGCFGARRTVLQYAHRLAHCLPHVARPRANTSVRAPLGGACLLLDFALQGDPPLSKSPDMHIRACPGHNGKARRTGSIEVPHGFNLTSTSKQTLAGGCNFTSIAHYRIDCKVVVARSLAFLSEGCNFTDTNVPTLVRLTRGMAVCARPMLQAAWNGQRRAGCLRSAIPCGSRDGACCCRRDAAESSGDAESATGYSVGRKVGHFEGLGAGPLSMPINEAEYTPVFRSARATS